MKSLFAFFLLVVACSATLPEPLTGGGRLRPIPKVHLDRDLSDVLAGLQSLAESLIQSFKGALDITGTTGTFLKNLQANVMQKLQAGHNVTVNLMGNLVKNTLQLAVDNHFLASEDMNRILVTFGVSGVQGAQPLEADDIKALNVAGDSDVADDFREGLQLLLNAYKTENKPLSILAGLESHVVELMAGNGIVQFKGVVALKRFFNLPALINALKHPIQTIGAISRFIKALESKIVGLVQGAKGFLQSLQGTLEAKFKAAGKLSFGLLGGTVVETLELAQQNNLVDIDGKNRLLVTFTTYQDGTTKPLMTESDVDSLLVFKDPIVAAKFKQTLKDLLQLKTGNYTSSFALLGGLEAALLNALLGNSLTGASGAAKILNKLGLTPISNLIDASVNLINDMQDGVAKGVVGFSTFTSNFKAAIQEKVKAGGDLTLDVLSKSLVPALNHAASNNVINAGDAARIAATFNVTMGAQSAQRLSVEEAGSLAIGGDADAAGAFQKTLGGLIQVLNDGGFGSLVTSLAGLNVAVVDLMAVNHIVGTSAAVGLKAFFVA